MGIVAARPLDGVKKQPPEVDIFFSRAEDGEFDPHKEWTMIESRDGYYEASRHPMAALQKISTERLVLTRIWRLSKADFEQLPSCKPHLLS